MLCFHVFIIQCAAQRENNVWAFGLNAGVDFTSGSPVAIETGINALEGTASVCDGQGNLLFYTHGDTIWNRNHDIMPDGILFPGRTTALTFSTSQAAVIVPIPDNKGNRYYVFSLETDLNNGGRLYYSIVNMDLDNGLGNVVAGQAAIRLDTPSVFTEKMTAVAGENCDAWLMLRSHSVNEYKAFNITDTGLNHTPVISAVGSITPLNAYRMGVIKFSQNRRKMAAAVGYVTTSPSAGGIEIYDFDPATGILSNTINIIEPPGAPPLNFGLEFSPDGNRLYALLEALYQFNLDLPTVADIRTSKTNILAVSASLTDLKLAPDGKIYFSSVNHDSLHRIESPNALGTASNPVLNVLRLAPGTKTQYGYPNVVAAAIPFDTVFSKVTDTMICTGIQAGALLELQVTPDDYAWEWEDGSVDTVRSITTAGTYWLYHKDRCEPKVDTFVVRGGYFPPLNITVNGDTLGTTAIYDSWQWYRDGQPIPGANQPTYVVDTNGTYSVRATMANGCSDWDPDAYTVTNVFVPGYAGMSGVRIYPNPAQTQVVVYTSRAVNNATVRLLDISGHTLLQRTWSGKDLQLDIAAIPPGIYIMSVQERGENVYIKMIKN